MRTSNMMQTKNWMALVGLTCAAFIFNTSEFIPIGLLTDIANDFFDNRSSSWNDYINLCFCSHAAFVTSYDCSIPI